MYNMECYSILVDTFRGKCERVIRLGVVMAHQDVELSLGIRAGRLLQTHILIGQEVQLSGSCPIRMSHQTNNNV